MQKILAAILLNGVLAGAFSFEMRANEFNSADDWRANPVIDVQIPDCPDANGVVRGTGKATTGESATALEITGYVTDAAELSHFEMKGATLETLSGGGRAKRVEVSVTGNKIGGGDASRIEADRIGEITFSAPTEADAGMREILQTAARAAIAKIFPEAAARFRSARAAWRSGACVEVKLAAAKTKLTPGEKIGVTARSFHKQDKTAISARLSVKEANAGAAPASQASAPQAAFLLTAPARGAGNASITVESISKRGIGIGKLEFTQDGATPTVKKPQTKPGTVKKPPVDDPETIKKPVKCKFGGWYGTISLETKARRDKQSGASGKSQSEGFDYTETVQKIDYQVFARRDASNQSVNAFFAEAEVYYSTKHYRSFVYRPSKCTGGNRIYDIPELKQEYVNRSEARGSGRVTIFISAYEKNSSFQLFAPKALGESYYEQAFSSTCPTIDEPNTFKRPGKPFEWQFKGILVEFINESAAAGVLSGSKTIKNYDGSETTVAWNLKGNCQ